MGSDRSPIICNPFWRHIFCSHFLLTFSAKLSKKDMMKIENWLIGSNNGSNPKPISSNQSEKFEAQSIRSSQNLPQKSTMKANQTGTAIWRHICEQVARRRDREKSQSENLRKRSRFWSRDSIVKDASHYLRFLHCSHCPSGQMNLNQTWLFLRLNKQWK